MNGEFGGSNAKARMIDAFSGISDQRLSVISSEAFCGNPVDRGEFYPDVSIMAEFIREICEAHTAAPAIIVYVRRQDDFLQSWHVNLVKNGYPFELDHFLSQIDVKSLDWSRVIEPYTRLFGSKNVIVRSYDALKRDPEGEISRFLFPFSKCLLNVSATGRANPALSPAGLSMMLALNRFPVDIEKRRLTRRFLETSFSQPSEAPTGYFADRIRTITAPMNARLESRFKVRFD